MNGAMVKALALDALYQVFDNRVFRILMVLVLIPVLLTFVIGFHEDEIVLLFGLKRLGYGGMISFFRQFGVYEAERDPSTFAINQFTSVVVEGIIGNFGLIFTIAATAFFVPRMIEKGAADVLFHKPLGRMSLYLSRYFAGLVFVALFSSLLVGGMYLGFLLVSRHHDPGILWAAVTLTYLFGLIHGCTMLVGVVTRSTVASILLAILFFLGNGCVHQTWILKEQGIMHEAVREAQDGPEAQGSGEDLDGAHETNTFFRLLFLTIDALHYVGPKTTDADYLTGILRKAVEGGPPFEDPVSKLTVAALPTGMRPADPEAATPPASGLDELLGDPVFLAVANEGPRALAVWARGRDKIEETFAGRLRTVPERPKNLAGRLEERLELLDLEPREIQRETPRSSSSQPDRFLRLATVSVAWIDGLLHHEVTFLVYADRVHALVLTSEAELDPEAYARWSGEILASCGVPNERARPDWYASQLGWRAPLKFNLFFSIGSSLAFAAVMLFLGWWRLSRIDF